MKREIVFVLFILLLILVVTEARAISSKKVLTQCPDQISLAGECLRNIDQRDLTEMTGVVDDVKCIEETRDFMKFQVHFVPQIKTSLLASQVADNRSMQDISFTLLKTDAKDNYRKSVYFIKGETPTLWLRRSQAAWKIAQVKWLAKDIQGHRAGPPTCSL